MRFVLTSNHEGDGVAGALSFRIRGDAGEVPGCGSSHALQDEGLLAQDNSRGDIAEDLSTLGV